jgi:hypothetical protein
MQRDCSGWPRPQASGQSTLGQRVFDAIRDVLNNDQLGVCGITLQRAGREGRR